jgi:hypothetical protein
MKERMGRHSMTEGPNVKIAIPFNKFWALITAGMAMSEAMIGGNLPDTENEDRDPTPGWAWNELSDDAQNRIIGARIMWKDAVEAIGVFPTEGDMKGKMTIKDGSKGDTLSKDRKKDEKDLTPQERAEVQKVVQNDKKETK